MVKLKDQFQGFDFKSGPPPFNWSISLAPDPCFSYTPQHNIKIYKIHQKGDRYEKDSFGSFDDPVVWRFSCNGG
jgi:hypothetical protein